MREIDVVIANQNGLHLRVAGAVVKAVRAHESVVRIGCDGCPSANACSVLQLLALAAPCGAVVRIAVEGPDEALAIQAVAHVLEGGAGI